MTDLFLVQEEVKSHGYYHLCESSDCIEYKKKILDTPQKEHSFCGNKNRDQSPVPQTVSIPPPKHQPDSH